MFSYRWPRFGVRTTGTRAAASGALVEGPAMLPIPASSKTHGHLHPRIRRLLPAVVATCMLATWGLACRKKSNATHPETLRHQQACKEYLEKQDLDVAETQCRSCLDYDKSNAECLNGLGLLWFLRGNNNQARTFYKAAIKARKDYPEPRNNLGVLEMGEQNYSKAVSLFQDAVKADPGYTDAHMNVSLAYRVLGDIAFTGSSNTVRDNKLDPQNPGVMKSTFAPAEAQYAKADDELRKVFEQDPRRFTAFAIMGFVELQRSRYDIEAAKKKAHLLRSQDMSQRCVALAPTDNPDARFCRGNLALAYEGLGNFEQAMSWWQGCLALDPKDPECVSGFNRAFAGFATRAGSLRKYVDQISNNPGYAKGHYNLCVGAFELNLTEIAASSCENALQLDKDLCMAHYQLGKHFKAARNKDKAVRHCKAFMDCSGEGNPAEAQECKDLVEELEVQ